MKILIPVTSFERGGGYRVLSVLATYWQRSGAHVDFLVDHRSARPYFPTEAGILRFRADGSLADGAAPVQANFAARGNARDIYLGMWRALNRIAADYDVVLANHSFTATPVALCRAGPARKFYYIQAYEPEYYAVEPGWKSRILQAYSAISYRWPLHQVANSPIYLGYRGIRARSWVPPGLDADIFHRRTVPPDLSRRPLVLGTIGRHEPGKGTADVLKAFERLADADPDIRLRVAYGNLPEGWSHPRCEIVVPTQDRELSDYYRSVDLLLAPGTVQLGACHYPVLEGMSCGTPVITTGYLPANDSNAWIVPVRDPAAIARAVTQARELPPQALLDKLDRAAEAVRGFHWDRVARQFLELMAAELGTHPVR